MTERPVLEGWTLPRRGSKAYNLHRAIRRHYQTKGLDAPFDMGELAEDYGLVCPTCGQRDSVCTEIPKRMRDAIVDFVNYYWESPEFNEIRDDGHSDSDLFRSVVEWAIRDAECYPVVHDPDLEAWSLMTLDSFARLYEMRAGAITSEVHRRSEGMETMMDRFRRYLPGKYTPRELLRDGQTFIAITDGEGE